MQHKERLSSTTRLAMAVTDKSDKGLLLLRFSLRNRRTTGLLPGVYRLSLISAKPSFKERSNVKMGFKALGEKFTPVAFLQVEILFGSSKFLKTAFLTRGRECTGV